VSRYVLTPGTAVKSNPERVVVMVPTHRLRHIEGFSLKKVQQLKNKILGEQRWTKPLCIERGHFLVMDGQHRMEVARELGLRHVPCLLFTYEEVEFWSLRRNCKVTKRLVITKGLSGNIYPYKTVKHRFPIAIPTLDICLRELISGEGC